MRQNNIFAQNFQKIEQQKKSSFYFPCIHLFLLKYIFKNKNQQILKIKINFFFIFIFFLSVFKLFFLGLLEPDWEEFYNEFF